MKATEFCYWLQGYFELSGADSLINKEKLDCIKSHLNMAFIHDIDPSYPKDQQEKLNNAHLKPGHQVPGDVIMRC